jgi:hypothetical protein
MFLLVFIFADVAPAQNRKSVSAAEVNGTFRYYFSGKSKGSYNEIKILALGKGKLKIAFELIYPYRDRTGAMTANMGSAEGEAAIDGDTAVYSSAEFEECKIIIKFVRDGLIRVGQEGTDAACGFGRNVSADGTYRKISRAKPKF